MYLRARGQYINEEFVARIWDKCYLYKDILRAKDGRRIEVVYQGQRNSDSGADFQGAEIKIDGKLYKGDIEVHVRNSHWRVHRHHTDSRYNNTILHVAMWDDGTNLLTKKQSGELIPTLILYDYLNSSIGNLWKKLEHSEDITFPCRKKIGSMDIKDAESILDSAGMDRFLNKVKIFEDRLCKNNADELLYEGMMDALGYSKNRKQFLQLARITPLKVLTGRPSDEIQAILLHNAGLLPSKNSDLSDFDDKTKEYICSIWSNYGGVLEQFMDTRMSAERWNFFRMRPGNFPPRRIAGISNIIAKCNNKSKEADNPFLGLFLSNWEKSGDNTCGIHNLTQDLLYILTPPASGYWAEHYNFGRKQPGVKNSLIGKNRADDILVNVVLPLISAYARNFKDKKLEADVSAIYTRYGKLQENRITRDVAERMFSNEEVYKSVVNSAMRQQGLIHLYRSFCSIRKCQLCPFGG
jgi:hypothetical protein